VSGIVEAAALRSTRGTLSAAADAARDGRAGLVLVNGRTGAGKTELLGQTWAELSARPGTVLRALGRGPKAAHSAVRELFAPLLDARAAGVGSLLASSLALVERSERGDSRTCFAALEGLRAATRRILAEGPLTVLLDDAHLADRLTLRWIDFTLRRCAESPLLVVLAYPLSGTGLVRELITPMGREAWCTTIELAPLAAADVAATVESAFGEPADSRFVRTCAELSGGNPGRLRALLDAVRHQGVGPNAAGASWTAAVGPALLAGAELDWVAGQPAGVRRVATGIAVLGDTTPRSVASLVGLPGDDVTDAVAALRRRGLLPERALRFADGQLRRAVLDRCPAEQLAELRLRAALWEQEAGRGREAAALLVELPALDEPWMHLVLRAAAVEALRAERPEEAARLLCRLLQAAPRQLGIVRELDAVLAAIDPCVALGLTVPAFQAAEDALACTLMLERFTALLLAAPRPAVPFDAVRGKLDDLNSGRWTPIGAAELRLRTVLETALVAGGLSRRATTAEVLRRARCMAAPGGGRAADRTTLAILGVTAMLDGESADVAVERAEAAVADLTGVPDGALMAAARVLHHGARPKRALEVLDAVLHRVDADRRPWLRAQALAARSALHRDLGNPALCAVDAEAAMRLTGDEPWAEPRIALASALYNQGAFEQAQALLAGIDEPTFGWDLPSLPLLQARLRIAVGDLEGGLELLFACDRLQTELGIRNPMLAPWWMDGLLLLDRLGRADEARAVVERIRRDTERWGTRESEGLGLAAVAYLEQGPAALTLMTQARRLLARSPMRLLRLGVDFGYGSVLLRQGETAAARAALREVVDLAVGCGCPVLGTVARDLLVAAGGRMTVASRKAELLTPAELRASRLAASGLSNRAIAESLVVTLRTVETHLSGAYRKLGITSRAELDAALRDR